MSDTRIEVKLGFTKNMGAGTFESLRLDFGVADDARDGETAQQHFNRVYGFVEQQLLTKVAELYDEVESVKK